MREKAAVRCEPCRPVLGAGVDLRRIAARPTPDVGLEQDTHPEAPCPQRGQAHGQVGLAGRAAGEAAQLGPIAAALSGEGDQTDGIVADAAQALQFGRRAFGER